MNVYNDVLTHVKSILVTLFPNVSVDAMQKIVVEPTKDATHGDISTNAAMVLSKPLGMNPRDVGAKLVEALAPWPVLESVTVAGPGFINMSFTKSYWHDCLTQMLSMRENYGKPSCADALPPVLIEYVSVNPTGPLHAGHGRNAILGDTIASLLQFYGYPVTREYYINDAGGQVDALARSAYVRYKQALGHAVTPLDFTEDMYGADYLVPTGQALAQQFGDVYVGKDESEWLDLFKEFAVNSMMNCIRADLTAAGIVMDVYTSEKAIAKAGLIDQMMDALMQSGDAYVGVLAAPKGITVDDWEEKPQTLFRATEYGDDVDRVIKKSNGGWTYFAGDAAYHYAKYKRGFHQMINIFGADHAGYLKRLNAVVAAMTQRQAKLEIKVTQMVNFMDNGTPVRMSKRAGVFITFRDVIDRVGIDATRYMMVSRHQDMSLDFDFAAVVAQNKDNPIFYIQYAHARIHSVLRHFANEHAAFSVDDLVNESVSLLQDDAELSMIKILSTWPRTIEMAVQYREPHRIANALYDIATAFHSLWNKGRENTSLRFIDTNSVDVTRARLALLWQVACVIKAGFNILGITAVEEMRQ